MSSGLHIDKAFLFAGWALFALFLLVSQCACSTTYREIDPVTGVEEIYFKTYGNLGIATSKISESNSASDGFAGLGGVYANDILTEARTTSIEEPTLSIGQMTMTGTLDHSTQLDVAGHWLWRNVRSIATAMVFWKGISAVENVQVSKNFYDNAAATSAAEISANEAIETTISNNKTAVMLAP